MVGDDVIKFDFFDEEIFDFVPPYERAVGWPLNTKPFGIQDQARRIDRIRKRYRSDPSKEKHSRDSHAFGDKLRGGA